MSRGVVLFSFIALFGIAGAAQSGGEKPRVPALGNANQQSPRSIGARSMTGADARISVIRLREPRKVQRLYNKALRAWADQKPAEAERRLEQALKTYPTFPEALTLHGGIQASLQHWKAAEESLRSAIQIDPTYPPAYVVLAGVYNGQSRFEEAQRVTQRALSAGADTWDVQYEIARTLIGKREYTHALTITESALHRKHGALLHLAQAHALAGLKRYRQSMTELRTYLHDEPDGEGSKSARNLLVQLLNALGE